MGKEIATQVQETLRVPNRINPTWNTPRHILIKLTKIKHKEQILKAAREKQQITQDVECFLALWRLLFAWLCFCSIFFCLFFYCLKLPCMKIYKHAFISANKAPLFHSRLGSLVSLFSSIPVPRSRTTKTVTVKNPPANVEDADLIPVLGRFPGGWNDNPL